MYHTNCGTNSLGAEVKLEMIERIKCTGTDIEKLRRIHIDKFMYIITCSHEEWQHRWEKDSHVWCG